jgi:hypothetical protein
VPAIDSSVPAAEAPAPSATARSSASCTVTV